jgi:hypothetical protein
MDLLYLFKHFTNTGNSLDVDTGGGTASAVARDDDDTDELSEEADAVLLSALVVGEETIS